MDGEDGPTLEDFERKTHSGKPGAFGLWLRALPYDKPTRVPMELRGGLLASEMSGYLRHYFGGSGIGSAKTWHDGSVWVLRRSVPKPRRNS